MLIELGVLWIFLALLRRRTHERVRVAETLRRHPPAQ